MQKEGLKVLVDQTQPQRSGKEFCLVRMANSTMGHAGDFAFLASGKLCSTLQKQFSICVDFTRNNWWNFIYIYYQSRAACHAKQAVLIQTHSSSGCPRSARDFVGVLRLFFLWFQNSTVDEGCSSFYENLPNLEFSKGLEWWLIISHLNELLQVTSRCSAASSSVNFSQWIFLSTVERCPFLIPSHNSCQAFLNLITDDWLWFLLTADYVLSECGLYEMQPGLFSCKQLGDFFSTDVRSAHKKVLTVFKPIWILLSDDWSRSSWTSFYKSQPGL